MSFQETKREGETKEENDSKGKNSENRKRHFVSLL